MRFSLKKKRAAQPATVEEVRTYEKHYDDDRLWDKFRKYAQRAGYELLEKALWLYYAAERPDTPAWARATAYGALGYFILPVDAIPDWLFAAGLTDDLGALTLAVGTLVNYIDDDVRRQTTRKLERWFGDKAPSADQTGETADNN